MEIHSKFLSEVISESTCECTLAIILPDFVCEAVQLAVSVLGVEEGGITPERGLVRDSGGSTQYSPNTQSHGLTRLTYL